MFAVVVRFAITMAVIPLAGEYLPAIALVNMQGALWVGFLLALVYTVLRPVVRMLLKVFNFCLFGLLYIAVDSWVIWILILYYPNSVILPNYWWAVGLAMVINAGRFLIDVLVGKK